MKLSKQERDMMQHALAWPKCYRNHYAVEPGTDRHEAWANLAEREFAVNRGIINEWPHELSIFSVTPAGRAALGDADG